MRTLIILMLLWMAMPLNSEELTPQYLLLECYPTKIFIKRFVQVYGEEIVFKSQSKNELGDELYHQLWMNPVTQTWTFMVSNTPKEMTCIIASGKGFAPLDKTGI